jgi:hypothetical protein
MPFTYASLLATTLTHADWLHVGMHQHVRNESQHKTRYELRWRWIESQIGMLFKEKSHQVSRADRLVDVRIKLPHLCQKLAQNHSEAFRNEMHLHSLTAA